MSHTQASEHDNDQKCNLQNIERNLPGVASPFMSHPRTNELDSDYNVTYKIWRETYQVRPIPFISHPRTTELDIDYRYNLKNGEKPTKCSQSRLALEQVSLKATTNVICKTSRGIYQV